MTSTSAYVRGAVLEQLRRDGIETRLIRQQGVKQKQCRSLARNHRIHVALSKQSIHAGLSI